MGVAILYLSRVEVLVLSFGRDASAGATSTWHSLSAYIHNNYTLKILQLRSYYLLLILGINLVYCIYLFYTVE